MYGHYEANKVRQRLALYLLGRQQQLPAGMLGPDYCRGDAIETVYEQP